CSDREWEPFWDAAEETGLPVSFHIGRGTSQVRVAPRSWELAAFSAVGPMQLDEPLAMMIYSGVLERHPKLRLVLAESGIGWLPYFVHRMDAAAEKHVPKAQDYRLRAKPSEIFRRQVYATFEEEPLGPELLPLRPRQLHVGLGLPAPGQHLPALAPGDRARVPGPRARLRRAG